MATPPVTKKMARLSTCVPDYWWDNPTAMKLVADQKRRVVLPKPAKPGDVYELLESGTKIVLVKLSRPASHPPPVSETPIDPRALEGIDIDEPAFPPIADENSS